MLMDAQIAETTLAQLGGAGRLTVMIGAKEFGATDGGKTLRFRFAAGSAKTGNVCRVTLTPADTYTVEFWYCRGVKYRRIAEFTDVYCDTLRRTFEQHTGLYLSL